MKGVLTFVGCLVAASVLAVIVLVHSLDRPWVKERLRSLVRTSAGVEIDYDAVRVSLLSGIAIDALVVKSPAEMRPLAPDLLRVGRVEARWSVHSLFGPGPKLERLSIADVALAVVVDENGRTSFDALSPPDPNPPPKASTPLSRRASILESAPPVAQIAVDRVALTLVRSQQGHASERSELHGLAVAVTAAPAGSGTKGWRVNAGLGSPTAPLDLQLARAGGDASATGRAKLWLTTDATSSALTTALDLRVIEQTFVPNLPVDDWLHAEAHVTFDPKAGRTAVTIDHTEASHGALTAAASIELPDVGDPTVRHAEGNADLARLLQWAPAGLVPVTAERAQLRYQIDSLVVGPVVHLSEHGTVAIDADLANVDVTLPTAKVAIREGKLSVHAQPAAGGGIAGRGSIELRAVSAATGADRFAADGVVLDVDGQQGADGVIAGRAGARFARLERDGPSPLVAREGHIELHVGGLRPNAAEPLATPGDVSLSVDLASLDARSPAAHVLVDGLALRAHTLLEGHAPYSVELDAPVARLRVLDSNGAPLADAPARVEARLRDVLPDLAHPAGSRAVVHVAATLDALQTSLELTKETDAADFTLRADAASLRAVRPFLPPDLASKVPLDRIALTVRSTGRVAHLAGGKPEIQQKTELGLDRPAFDTVAARSLSLSLASQGTALQHKADIDLHAQGLAFNGGSASDDHVTLSATVDREHGALQFQLATEGRAATKLSGSASFDPSRKAVAYRIEGHLAQLAPLAPFAAKVHGLDAFDLSELDVGLAAHGAILGVVAGFARDGTIALEPTPARTAAVEGDMDLRLAHFRWSKGDTAILTPAMTLHASMRTAGDRRTLDSRLEIGTLHLDLGSHDVDLNGIDDDAKVVVLGSVADPEIELTQHLSVRAVVQDLVPEYPVGDLAFALTAERGREGIVHISDMNIANGLGGTTLAVTGNVDLGEGRRTLSVTTSITQELARLSTIPERFKGRGKVAAEATVLSPDLIHYQVRAALKGQDVNVTLPRDGIEMETANGEVPITVALVVNDSGAALQKSEKRSPYSMLRFADQHPLLSRSGFLSIARLKTPFVSIAPLVGNLEIEQNVISLRQFEMGVRGGRITGQCGIDWDGLRSTLELHVRASGVQSSHGEPFDGNIAIVVSAADRTVEGRAEILRIGERHLLDLLDLQDPLHVDPAMNRTRSALNFGYPDNLRLVFDHGFASAHLELGGLARLISIGEVRGIPMGPIVDKVLGPLLDGPDMKETP